MTAVSLLALPLTVASTIIQDQERQKAIAQAQADAANQQALDQQRKALAQQQIALDAAQQQSQLLSQQATSRAALLNNYYRGGIDPASGSAQNALSALSRMDATALNNLAQTTALRQRGADLIGAGDRGAAGVPSYNPLPTALNLFNTISGGVNDLLRLQNQSQQNQSTYYGGGGEGNGASTIL